MTAFAFRFSKTSEGFKARGAFGSGCIPELVAEGWREAQEVALADAFQEILCSEASRKCGVTMRGRRRDRRRSSIDGCRASSA